MISCQDIRFSYAKEAFALEIPSFSLGMGECVALVGPSGCGKSTFINLISGILVPSQGEIRVQGNVINQLPLAERQEFRLQNIGQVPQSFELLSYLQVKENILVPLRLDKAAHYGPDWVDRMTALADRSGISDLLEKFPGELSQGERQRVALCRGLIGKPSLVLADEPTGNLDPDNQAKIVELLLSEARDLGASVVMITHDPGLLGRFDRVVDMMELRQMEEE